MTDVQRLGIERTKFVCTPRKKKKKKKKKPIIHFRVSYPENRPAEKPQQTGWLAGVNVYTDKLLKA